ncbi:hypothetical protein HU200_011797 [Digitaria exilis]|uniref:Uncharacterized protein n=1 Tax=Digitaria exilis TaxID=1010633 RepID=A0A835KQE5_9POAL|nr:hypothetical protein HU200_011797 [Digitaria exilis]
MGTIAPSPRPTSREFQCHLVASAGFFHFHPPPSTHTTPQRNAGTHPTQSAMPMPPVVSRSDRVVRRTAMVGAATAAFLLLTADYGPNYPNPVRTVRSCPPFYLCYDTIFP